MPPSWSFPAVLTGELAELLLLFGMMVLQVVVPPLPAEVIVVSAGRLYGALPTTLAAGTGLYVGSVIVYLIGTLIHRKFARFFDQERTRRAIARLHQYETPILWVRLLPYNPSDLISYAAGIIRVQPAKFMLISFCTSYGRTLLLALLGMHISNIKTLMQVVSVLLLSALLGSAALYGTRRK